MNLRAHLMQQAARLREREDEHEIALAVKRGERVEMTGVVDNDFWGDSIIWLGPIDGGERFDLDDVFKELDGERVTVTIRKRRNEWGRKRQTKGVET